MRQKEFYDEHGTTRACTLRLLEGSSHGGRNLNERKIASENKEREKMLGDSWFASVQFAEEMSLRGMDFVGPVSDVFYFNLENTPTHHLYLYR